MQQTTAATTEEPRKRTLYRQWKERAFRSLWNGFEEEERARLKREHGSEEAAKASVRSRLVDFDQWLARPLRHYIREPEKHEARYGPFGDPVFRGRLPLIAGEQETRHQERIFRTLLSRQERILELVYSYGALTTDQLMALLRAGESVSRYDGEFREVRSDLSALFHHSYLARLKMKERPRAGLPEHAAGTVPKAYLLDRCGWEHLELLRRRRALEQGEAFDPVRWAKIYTRRAEPHYQHALERSEFHLTLELAVRGRGDLELEWDQRGLVFEMTDPRLWGDEKRKLVPDAYAALYNDGWHRNFFIEADRSTETVKKRDVASKALKKKDVADKILKYLIFLNSDAFTDYCDEPDRVNVLFVCKSALRVANIARVVRELTIPPLPHRRATKATFWFTTWSRYDREKPESILQPIWTSATKPDELRALV